MSDSTNDPTKEELMARISELEKQVGSKTTNRDDWNAEFLTLIQYLDGFSVTL
jgi:hypothetical protein